jgi:hypothetical protein
MIGDEVLAKVPLDCLFYKCEVIKLAGKIYRIEHRTTIFNKKQPAERGLTIEKTITASISGRNSLLNDVI